MALLNAHTLTRSFRECQYDLKVLLDGIDDISPIDHTGGGIVELKWADGSIDLVPSTEFIKGLVPPFYAEIKIGGKANIYPSGRGSSNANNPNSLHLLMASAGVQAHITELGTGTEDLVIRGGKIKILKADTLTLNTGVRIGSMQVGGTIHTDYCSVSDSAKVGGILTISGDNTFANLNLERVHISCPIRFVTKKSPVSDLSAYWSIRPRAGEVIYGQYVIRHTMSFADIYDSTIQDKLTNNNAQLYVQVPIPRMDSGSDATDESQVVYDYVQTVPTDLSDMHMDTPFSEDSESSLLTLYPIKSRSYESEYETMYLKVEVPDTNEYLTHVCNPTASAIRVCNAWMFTEGTVAVMDERASRRAPRFYDYDTMGNRIAAGSVTAGKVVPLNYIVLPPYSCTDFLFKHEIKGGNYCAYMMPTVDMESA